MTRSDGKKFDAGVSGDLATYIDIGAKGSVELRSDNTVSFSSCSGEVAAFAYKAGQLNKHEDRWTFEPEGYVAGLCSHNFLSFQRFRRTPQPSELTTLLNSIRCIV